MDLRRITAAALLPLALVGCSDDGGDDRARPPRTDDSTSPAETESQGVGGSRYLAYQVLTEEDTIDLVLEDLVAETAAAVVTDRETLLAGDVNAAGAVTWEEWTDDGVSTSYVLARDADEPVRVSAVGAGCPRWRADGSLLVVISDGEDTGHPAIVDPETGEVDEELVVPLDPFVCVQPDGLDHLVFARPLGPELYGPEGGEIVRVGLDGGEEEVVGHIAGGCWANDMDVSATGDALAAGVHCGDDASEQEGIYVGTLEDDLRPLVAENEPGTPFEETYQYWSPTWAADGRHLAYHRFDPGAGADGQSRVWTTDLDGGEPVEHGPVPSAGPALSPPAGGGRD